LHIERLMEYGHGVDNLTSFIRWWITNDGRKEGEAKGRSRIYTISARYSELDLELKKDVIFSDETRALRNGEVSISDGLEEFMKEIKKWLKEKTALSPEEVDVVRYRDAKKQFGMAGMGFFVRSVGITDLGLLIHTDVIGIPK